MNCAQLTRRANELKKQLSEGQGDPRVVRYNLQDVYREILVSDLEYALDKKLEQELWNNIFKNHISSLQTRVRDKMNPKRGELQSMLTLTLDSATGFFLQLLQELCVAFNLELPFCVKASRFGLAKRLRQKFQKVVVPQLSSCLYICQYCLVHLGDLARYRSDTDQAHMYYNHAVTLIPTNGQPYNQLAIVSASKSDQLSMTFYYIRSIAVKHPFPAALTNLQSTFSKLVDRDEMKIFKMRDVELIHYFIKFHAVIYMASGESDLQVASNIKTKLEENLRDHLSKSSLTARQLVQITAVNLFALCSLRQLEDNGTATTGGKRADEGERSGLNPPDEEQCWRLTLDLTLMLAQLLLYHVPGFSAEVVSWLGLPALRIMMEWLQHNPKVMADDTVTGKYMLWHRLGKLLSMLYLQSPGKPDDKSTLWEDLLLNGFRPLQEAHRDLVFSSTRVKHPTKEEGNITRVERLIESGKKLAVLQPSLLQWKKSDSVPFTSPRHDAQAELEKSLHPKNAKGTPTVLKARPQVKGSKVNSFNQNAEDADDDDDGSEENEKMTVGTQVIEPKTSSKSHDIHKEKNRVSFKLEKNTVIPPSPSQQQQQQHRHQSPPNHPAQQPRPHFPAHMPRGYPVHYPPQGPPPQGPPPQGPYPPRSRWPQAPMQQQAPHPRSHYPGFRGPHPPPTGPQPGPQPGPHGQIVHHGPPMHHGHPPGSQQPHSQNHGLPTGPPSTQGPYGTPGPYGHHTQQSNHGPPNHAPPPGHGPPTSGHGMPRPSHGPPMTHGPPPTHGPPSNHGPMTSPRMWQQQQQPPPRPMPPYMSNQPGPRYPTGPGIPPANPQPMSPQGYPSQLQQQRSRESPIESDHDGYQQTTWNNQMGPPMRRGAFMPNGPIRGPTPEANDQAPRQYNQSRGMNQFGPHDQFNPSSNYPELPQRSPYADGSSSGAFGPMERNGPVGKNGIDAFYGQGNKEEDKSGYMNFLSSSSSMGDGGQRSNNLRPGSGLDQVGYQRQSSGGDDYPGFSPSPRSPNQVFFNESFKLRPPTTSQHQRNSSPWNDPQMTSGYRSRPDTGRSEQLSPTAAGVPKQDEPLMLLQQLMTTEGALIRSNWSTGGQGGTDGGSGGMDSGGGSTEPSPMVQQQDKVFTAPKTNSRTTPPFGGANWLSSDSAENWVGGQELQFQDGYPSSPKEPMNQESRVIGRRQSGSFTEADNLYSSGASSSYSLFTPSPWSDKSSRDPFSGSSPFGSLHMKDEDKQQGGSNLFGGLGWGMPVTAENLSGSPTSTLLPERIQSIWSSPLSTAGIEPPNMDKLMRDKPET